MVAQALEALTEKLRRAWNAHDAGALGEFYAADADFVDASGAIIQGREAIVHHHRRAFGSTFARSALALTTVKVRVIGGHTGVVHAVWSLRGHEHPQWLPVSTGALLLLFIRSGERWEVTLAHSTVIPRVIPP